MCRVVPPSRHSCAAYLTSGRRGRGARRVDRPTRRCHPRAGWGRKGTLKDESVRELRRSWRRIREVAAGFPIRVELADVGFVDPAGQVLLAEMYRGGVEIVANDCLAATIRDDIVDRSTRDRC
jgi:hypothetical protein